MVTDQDPVEIARNAVWEKMLDILPDEVPYEIDIVSSPQEIYFIILHEMES